MIKWEKKVKCHQKMQAEFNHTLTKLGKIKVLKAEHKDLLQKIKNDAKYFEINKYLLPD
ncbi:MAG: hypothetical protein ACTSVV_08750 [Promethearchaeota archaeon]